MVLLYIFFLSVLWKKFEIWTQGHYFKNRVSSLPVSPKLQNKFQEELNMAEFNRQHCLITKLHLQKVNLIIN